jgi:hypothetical protein
MPTVALLAAAPLLFTACASGEAWSPHTVPSAQADGYEPPTGPHSMSVRIETENNGTYNAGGYIDMRPDGRCALDVVISGETANGAAFAADVVKPMDEPAYRRTVETRDTTSSQWFDTRDIEAPRESAFLLVSPLGVVLSGNPDTASWCYLTALPAVTNLDDSAAGIAKYTWDDVGLNAYVKSESDAFITNLLDAMDVSGTARSVMAGRLADANPNDAHFTQFASPLTVAENGDVTVLSYRMGSTDTVTITLKPTKERTISTPDGASPWTFYIDVDTLTAPTVN